MDSFMDRLKMKQEMPQDARNVFFGIGDSRWAHGFTAGVESVLGELGLWEANESVSFDDGWIERFSKEVRETSKDYEAGLSFLPYQDKVYSECFKRVLSLMTYLSELHTKLEQLGQTEMAQQLRKELDAFALPMPRQEDGTDDR